MRPHPKGNEDGVSLLLLILLTPPTPTLVRQIHQGEGRDPALAQTLVEREVTADPENWSLQQLREQIWRRTDPTRWQQILKEWKQSDSTSPWPWVLHALDPGLPLRERQELLQESAQRSDDFLPRRYLEIALQLQQGDLSAARQQLSQLQRHSPKDPWLLQLQGAIALEGRDWKEATRAFKEALTQLPANVSLWNQLVESYYESGQWALAESALVELRYLAPQLATGEWWWVRLAAKRDRLQTWLERAQQAQQRFPADERFLLELCEALVSLQDWGTLRVALQENGSVWHRIQARHLEYSCALAWGTRDEQQLQRALSEFANLELAGIDPSETKRMRSSFQGRLAYLQGDGVKLSQLAKELPDDLELGKLAVTWERAERRSNSRNLFLGGIAVAAFAALLIALKSRKRPTP